jgi:hypothetical protein
MRAFHSRSFGLPFQTDLHPTRHVLFLQRTIYLRLAKTIFGPDSGINRSLLVKQVAYSSKMLIDLISQFNLIKKSVTSAE